MPFDFVSLERALCYASLLLRSAIADLDSKKQSQLCKEKLDLKEVELTVNFLSTISRRFRYYLRRA